MHSIPGKFLLDVRYEEAIDVKIKARKIKYIVRVQVRDEAEWEGPTHVSNRSRQRSKLSNRFILDESLTLAQEYLLVLIFS